MLTMPDALFRSRRTSARHTAVVCGSHTFDHAALAERCERVVGALNGLGLGPTDRVAVLAANCHRYIEAYLGVPSAGSVLVPMNTRLAAVEHLAIISAARPQLLLTDRDPGSLADHVPRVMTVDEWDALVTESEPAALGGAGAGEDDLALLYFTSGTTGRPKGVTLTHRNLVANVFHKALACELRGSDVFLAAAPFFHVAGTAPVLSLVWLGGTLVVLPAFDAAACLDTIEQQRVTVAMPVPTMLAALVDEQRARPRDVSSLRLLGHAGSPISTALIRRAHETFPDAELAQFYGATETASIVTCMPHEERHLDDGRLGSCGQPVVGVSVSIVDDVGAPCAPGEVGEVVVRGPNVTSGYWENEGDTSTAFIGDWYRTGDIGYLDDDSYLWLLDRKADMIVTGGENVYSIEVEEVLSRHPRVLECVVFGVPDERWVEAVHAIVVVSEDDGRDADLAEVLRDHCRASLAGFKVPKRIEVSSTPLPKSGPGKVKKRELKSAYWSRLVALQAAAERADAAQQRGTQRLLLVAAEVGDHPSLDLAHLLVAGGEHLAALGGDTGLQDPAVIGVSAAAHQASLFQREQHLVHRLRRHQSAPRQLSVGQPAAMVEHAQRRVLVHRKAVSAHHFVDRAPHDPIDATDEIEERRPAVR